jgi:integrase
MRLYRRKNGYYYYELERNKPRSLKTKEKREAQALYKIIKRIFLKGQIKELDTDKPITLSQFKEIFFLQHTDIADDTIDAYDLAIRLFIDSVGGSTLLGRISSKSHIVKFKNDCRTRGVRKTSVNTYLRHLRTIFNKAHEWGYISKKIKIEFFKTSKRHPRTLSRTEKIAIYRYAKKNDYDMYRIIKFALWTGARREEIYNLDYRHIKGDLCRVIGKGDKERTIPLLPAAIRAIGNQKDLGPVFWHPLDIDKVTKEFKKIARACGIEDVHLHNLRHTAATDMLASGMRIEYVKEILGHEDIKTTMIYAKILQRELKKEMQKMRSKRGQ